MEMLYVGSDKDVLLGSNLSRLATECGSARKRRADVPVSFRPSLCRGRSPRPPGRTTRPAVLRDPFDSPLISNKQKGPALKGTAFLLVRTEGVEPSQPCGRQHLKLVRLPFRHVRVIRKYGQVTLLAKP